MVPAQGADSDTESVSSQSEISRHLFHVSQQVDRLDRNLSLLQVHFDRVAERVGRLEEIDRVAEAVISEILRRLARLETALQLDCLD